MASEHLPPDLRRLRAGGFDLAYRDAGDAGSGPTLLLVHGFPFDHRQWGPQIATLATRCRVIVPDLRGHGASDAPSPPYTMVAIAEDLRILLDRLDLDRVVVGGLSMGGYVALEFADRYPERLDGLALISTRTEPDTPAGREARIATAHAVRREGVSALLEPMLDKLVGDHPVDADVRALLGAMIGGTSIDGLIGALEGMAARRDTTQVLSAVRCPALVMAGGIDAITPPDGARDMAARLADAELVVVEGAGHVLALERPEAVSAALTRLVDRAAAAG